MGFVAFARWRHLTFISATCSNNGLNKKAVIKFLIIERLGEKKFFWLIGEGLQESSLHYLTVKSRMIQFWSDSSDISDTARYATVRQA